MQKNYFSILKTVTRLVFSTLKIFTKVETLAASGGIFQTLTLHIVNTKIYVRPSQMFLVFSSIFNVMKMLCKTNQELKQQSVKVELLKPTTPKICFLCHLFTKTGTWQPKPSIYLYIKCQSNSESYNRHGYLWASLRGGRIFNLQCARLLSVCQCSVWREFVSLHLWLNP